MTIFAFFGLKELVDWVLTWPEFTSTLYMVSLFYSSLLNIFIDDWMSCLYMLFLRWLLGHVNMEFWLQISIMGSWHGQTRVWVLHLWPFTLLFSHCSQFLLEFLSKLHFIWGDTFVLRLNFLPCVIPRNTSKIHVSFLHACMAQFNSPIHKVFTLHIRLQMHIKFVVESLHTHTFHPFIFLSNSFSFRSS